MKISYTWLKDYITTDLTVDEVSTILTDTGLEVEGVEEFESIKGGLRGFCIGEVKSTEQHPDADRLKLCKVDVGGEALLDIVCGAPNAAAGQKVAVAMVGCEVHMPDGTSFKIKKSKIRGAVSEGMLCAEDELGIGEGHDGIMVIDSDLPLGTPLAEVVGLESDQVIEIGLTPNRSDAISHFGVARDLAAYLNQTTPIKASLPEVSIDATGTGKIKVEVKAKEACIRYAGLELEGITVAPSPDWLQQRIKAIGLGPINNVVDITNYVMHETGQPLHAFDRDKITGDVVQVRFAQQGEEFTTLDDAERSLDAADLMIANAGESMCMAGVFGGKESGVSDSTTSIFLESAVFDAVSVRKTAKRHGLNTDSSFRFERGVDPNTPLYALKRAAQMIQEICSAQVCSAITDIYPETVDPLALDFDVQACHRLIGQVIPEQDMKAILKSLDFAVDDSAGDVWALKVPTYRVDVTRQADVVEEILRIYGFNRIELPTHLRSSITHSSAPDRQGMRERLSLLLNGQGYTEIMCNSLSSAKYPALLDRGEETKVAMLNPLSQDLAVLRQTMLWGALETIAYNQNRQMPDFKGFEFGSVYSKQDGEYVQEERLSVFHTGRASQENWDSAKADASIYDLSILVETLLANHNVKARKSDGTIQLRSQSRIWSVGDRIVASVGLVEAKVLKAFDVKQAVCAADIDWTYITKKAHSRKIKVQPIPKFPAVRRDFSLLLDSSIDFARVEELAMKQGGKMLKEVGLFDVYEGKNLPAGKKSYAVSFLIQDEQKTLTDKVVDKLMTRIQQTLEKEVGAELRS